MGAAAVFTLLAVIFFGPAGVWLDRAGWLNRAPRAGIALWQAVGTAGAISAVGAGLALAVAPLRVGLAPGVVDLMKGALDGHPLRDIGMTEAFGLTLAADVAAVLLAGLIMTAVRSAAARHRHRILLDLVSKRSEQVPDTVLLDDPRAAAYCLPGIRPRIVLSVGTLDLLDVNELGAVVAHERGHAHEHHDLLLLPVASMVDMLRWMPYVRRAPTAVARLLEMAADDYAARRHDPRALASALVQMASSQVAPACAFGATSGTVALRVRRLLEPHRTSGRAALVAGAAAAALVAVPLLAVALG